MAQNNKAKKTLAATLAVLSLAAFSGEGLAGIGLPMLDGEVLVASAATNCAIVCSVKTKSGKAISGAECVFKNQSGQVVASGKTGASGTVVLSVPSGNTYTWVVTINGVSNTLATYSISSNQTEKYVYATYEDTAVSTTCALTVNITNNNTGAAISGVAVKVTDKSTGKVVAQGTTNSSGSVQLSVPKGASYTISATYNGITRSNDISISSANSSASARISFVDSEITGVCNYTIKVTNEDTGTTVSGAVVKAENVSTGAVIQGITNSSGETTLVLPTNQTYSLSIECNGFTINASNLLTIPSNAVSSYTLPIAIPNSVADGKCAFEIDVINNSTGAAVSGVSVEIKSKSTGTVVAKGTTNTSGAFQSSVPMNQTYTIKVTCNGWSKEWEQTIENNSFASMSVSLPDNIVKGKCTLNVKSWDSSAGTYISGASVKVTDKSTGTVVAQGTTDSTGCARCEVPYGKTYAVSVTYNGVTKTEDKTIDTIDSNITTDNIIVYFTAQEITKYCKTTFTAKDSTGTPLTGAVITVTNTTTSKIVNSATTNSSGQVVLDLPDNGTYSINCYYGNGKKSTILSIAKGKTSVSCTLSVDTDVDVQFSYKDANGQLVKGDTVFKVYEDKNSDGKYTEGTDKLVTTIESSSGKFAVLYQLFAEHKYLLVQTDAPQGYICNTKVYPFILPKELINNSKYNPLEDYVDKDAFVAIPATAGVAISYKNTSDKGVGGAVIGICKDNNENGKYDTGDEIVLKGTTPTDGILKTSRSALATGQPYLVTVLTVPKEYQKDNAAYSFTLKDTDAGTTVNLNSRLPSGALTAIPDVQKAGIKLICRDTKGNAVKGAVIGICKDTNKNGKYDKGDIIVMKAATPSNGILSSSKSALEVGQQYLVTVLSAPSGYTRKNTMYPFTLKATDAGKVVNLHNYLPKDALIVKKN